MAIRQIIGVAAVLLAAGALSMTAPGCGSSQETGPNGEVKAIPPVNPAPGSTEPEKPVSNPR